jgi:anti-sigma factor RsiW
MMHDIVIEELETHLSGGGVYQTASREFYAHLAACDTCRAEVSEMDELSILLRELKTGPAGFAGPVPEPAIGFYARVRSEIVEKQQKEVWGLFSPGTAAPARWSRQLPCHARIFLPWHRCRFHHGPA